MTAHLILALAGLAGGDPVDPPSQLRIYDVGTILPGTATQRSRHCLLPIYAANASEMEGDSSGEEAVQVFSELVKRLNPEEWQLNGREILVDDLGRMLVRAPAPLQESTAQAMAFYAGVFERTIDLAIDIVTLPATGEPLPSLVPVGDVARYLGQGGGAGPKSFRLRLAPGRAAAVDATRTVEFVADYNAEIAERISVWDPIRCQVTLGTTFVAQAASAPRGIWLAAVVRSGTQYGEIEARDIRFDGLSISEQRATEVQSPRTLQRLNLANRSMAVNTYLPEGKALVLRTVVDLGSQRVQELVFVRQEGASVPVHLKPDESIAKASTRGDLMLVQRDSAVPPRAEFECNDLSPASGSLLSAWYVADADHSVTAFVRERGCDTLKNLLGAADGSLDMYEIGGWLVLHRDPERIEPGAEKVDPLTVIGRLMPDPRLFQVSLSLRRGASEVIARAVLPVRDGVPSAIVVGREGCMITDWDVEVAQGASCTDPQVQAFFEGLVASVEPRVTVAGTISLTVAARGVARRGVPRAFDAGSSAFSVIDQSDRDLLAVNEIVYLAKDGGVRRASLGATAPTGDALSLEVEVQEVH